jgi:VanZ family protein
MRSALAAWLLVALWAAVIFVFSAVPHLHATEGDSDLVLRKIAHLAEYAVLGILVLRALLASGVRRPEALALAVAVAYAATDEWHQSFVEGRNGRPLDVAIDAVGIGIGLLLARRLPVLRRVWPA